MPDRSCQDCGAVPGTAHLDGCDTARCLSTGHQRLSCPEFGWSDPPAGVPGPAHDCGQDVWTGQWPGSADAARLGWWCRPTNESFARFERCGPKDPGAMPDLNRLAIDGRWNPELGQWEARNA